MPLTEQEREELERLERKFGSPPECTRELMIQGDRVYPITFIESLVEEDERYDYLGKFDDLAPGKRIGPCLGSKQEFDRFVELRRKAKQ